MSNDLYGTTLVLAHAETREAAWQLLSDRCQEFERINPDVSTVGDIEESVEEETGAYKLVQRYEA